MFLDKLVRNDNIIKIAPNETLSSALTKLSTSHDAAFLFSFDNRFLGVINPYYCLIQKSYPGNARVEHCIYHPPKIKINTPIEKVATAFIESKIHYLPVFDEKDRFKGMVSARALLNYFQSHLVFSSTVGELLKTKNRPLMTINENDTIALAISYFKKTKFSKLVVVGKENRLKGILSYYDLINFLVAPKDAQSRGQREGVKINASHQKVSNFSKKYVLTLNTTNTITDVIKLILSKGIGSVVILNDNKKPMGIITTRDILRFFIFRQRRARIEIISKNLSEKSKHIFGAFFRPFSHLLNHSNNLSKTRIIIKEEKQGGLFKVMLSLFPKKGEPKVIHQEGKSLSKILPSLNEIIRNIIKKD